VTDSDLAMGLQLLPVHITLVISKPTPSNAYIYIQAIERIHKAMGALGLNVNEALVLQALFLQCPSLMPMPQVAPVN